MVENKVIVMMRLENGNDIKCSVKATGKPLSDKDKKLLLNNIKNKMLPHIDDMLYFTVRTRVNETKNNYKTDNVLEMNNLLEGIFSSE